MPSFDMFFFSPQLQSGAVLYLSVSFYPKYFENQPFPFPEFGEFLYLGNLEFIRFWLCQFFLIKVDILKNDIRTQQHTEVK